jgi:hypothetical protein
VINVDSDLELRAAAVSHLAALAASSRHGSVRPVRYAVRMPNEPRYVLFASDEPKPMGDTLLEYAQPLIARLPRDHTFDELQATIVFAALVWNIGLFDEVCDAVAHLATKMPPRLRLRAPQALVLIRRMLTWKQDRFPGDGRAALAVEIDRDGVAIRVRALGIVGNRDEHASLADSRPRNVRDSRSSRRWVH